MATQDEIEAAAGAIFCHFQFKGDAFTARRLAADALEAAERARWQPIETAPKDLDDDEAWYLGFANGCGLIQWTQDGWCDTAGSQCQPTHWQPLPSPPESK